MNSIGSFDGLGLSDVALATHGVTGFGMRAAPAG
jgi:hypothetical protein